MNRTEKKYKLALKRFVWQKAVFLFALVAVTGVYTNAAAAEGDMLQSYPYQHVLAGKQEAAAVAVDPAGYIIIGGSTADDFLTVKVKADGSAKLWEKTFDLNGGTDHLEAVAVDSNGDVIVTGYASKGVNNQKDIITIKYDGTDGTVLWQATYNNTDNDGADLPFAIALDSLNNIFIAGKTQGSGGDEDGLLLKYSPDGANPDGTPIWFSTYDGSGTDRNDQWVSVSAGMTGVAVTGITDVATDPDPANFNIITMLYNLDSTDGWAGPVIYDSGFAGDSGLFVAMDSNDDVILAAKSGANNGDFYTVKYSNADGSIDAGWGSAKTYNGGSMDEPRGLWVDGNDDVYVTGSTFLGASTDYYTIRYNGSDGGSAWGGGKIYNSGLDQGDIPVAIVVDDAGDVFVTGYSIISGTNYDFTTLKYRKDNGTQLWTPPVGVYSGAAGKKDQPLGLGLGNNGELFVGGWTDTAADDYDFVAIKYDPGNLNSPTALEATTVSDTAIDLSWTDNAGNETGFKIWRKLTEQGSWAEIDTVLADVTTYSDTGLTSHAWYYYKVQAYNAGGVSHFTNTDAALTTVLTLNSPTWEYRYDNADNMDDWALAIAAGPDNNPVVTGFSLTSANGSGPSKDYYTVKLDRTNATKIWDASYNNIDIDGSDVADCVAVDSNNEVTVAGQSFLNNAGVDSNDIYTRKYSANGPYNGNPPVGDPYLWSDQYSGPSGNDDRSEAIDSATDGSNNVVILGYGMNGDGNNDIYVVKYPPDGNVVPFLEGAPSWAAIPYDGGFNDLPAAISFDPAGDVIVTGKTHKNALPIVDPSADSAFFTRKYSDSGNGSTIWTVEYDHGTGLDGARDMAVDANGDVYVVGYIDNGATNDDIYIVKYDGDAPGPVGAVLWFKIIDGPGSGDDIAEAVRVDPNTGDIVVSGTVEASGGNNDFFLIRYDSAGNKIWEKQLERVDNDDHVTVMDMDASGNVCVAGNTDTVDAIDILAVKYDHDGNILGGTLYSGPGDNIDDAWAITANSYGEFYVAGYSETVNGDFDYLVMQCLGDVVQAPSPLTATAHYTSVDLAWTDNSLDEDGYNIKRKLGTCDSGGTWTIFDPVLTGVLAYTDEGVNLNNTYCYSVQTYKGSMVSRWLTVEVTTETPTAPSSLVAEVLNTTEVKLTWQDNTATETGFHVRRCIGATCAPLISAPANATGSATFIDTTACPGETYTYEVQAYKTGKWTTGFSNKEINIITDTLPAPTLLVATRVAEARVDLAWSDNTNDETGFSIQRCSGTSAACNDGDFSEIGNLDTADGNVLLLEMEEASWPHTANDVLDESGNANHATSAGNANTGADGVYGRRGELDGNGDYLTTALTIDQSATSAGATMMAWVYPSSTSVDNHYLFSTENGSAGSENHNWGVYRNGGTWYVDTGSGGTSTGVAVTAGQWQHIAVVFDPAGIRFYKNGNKTTMAVPGNNDTAQAFTIGRRGVLNQEFFDGFLDEVAVFDQPLSDSNILDIIGLGVFKPGEARFADTTAMSFSTTYTYRVVAQKTDACNWPPAPTNEVQVLTDPLPPGNVSAIVGDSTRVKLTWTDETTSEDFFKLERCAGTLATCLVDGDFSTTVSSTIPANTTEYIDTSVCGGQYVYQLRALRTSNWESAPSTKVVADLSAVLTAAPTGLASDSASEEEISLNWVYDDSDRTGYRIDRCTGDAGACSGGPWIQANEITGMPANLVGLWRLDEFSWNDVANEVKDSSGNNKHGQAKLGAHVATPGRYGYGAAEFDGVDDYIVTTLNIDQSFASNGATMEAWVYPTSSTNTWRYVVTTDNGGYDWGIIQLGSTWYVSNGLTWQSTGITVGINQWQHVAAVFDPDAGITFYKNGTQVYSSPAISFETSYSNVTIGRYGSSNNYLFIGKIDEVAVYDRPLSAEEVQDRAAKKFRYDDGGLLINTTYTYRVRAYETCGWNGAYDETTASTDATVPAPTVPSAAAVDTTTVSLSWTDNTTSETGYRVQRCTGSCDSGGDYSGLDVLLAPDATSYIDTTACSNETYTYRVRAEGGAGFPSSWLYFTAVATANPPLPGLSLEVLSESEIGISWVDNSTDEETYTLTRCGPDVACVDPGDFTTSLQSMSGANGRLLHYRFDEGDGVWQGNTDEVVDISGNNKHGKAYGGAYTSPTSKYGRAGYFDGTDDYVATPVNLDQTLAGTAITMEAWVYPTSSTNTWRYIIGTDNGGYDWGILQYGSTWRIATGSNWISTGITVDLNTWQHVSAVFVPGTGVTFYKNGTEVFNTSDIDYDTSDSNITIGRYGSSNNYLFQGYIDEVIVYDHGLSQAEITDHATNQVLVTDFVDTGLTPGKTYYYRVAAEKAGACGTWPRGVIQNATTTAPPPPTDLAVVSDTSSMTLTWTDNSGSETGYEVQYCVGDNATCCPGNDPDACSGTFLTDIPVQGVDAETYVHDVCAPKTYTYRVRAVKAAAWETAFDGPVTAQTQTSTPPVIQTANRISEVEIDLTWTDTTSDETGFELKRCIGGDCTTIPLAADSTTYKDNELVPNTAYTYQVFAVKTGACNWPLTNGVTVPANTNVALPGGLGVSSADTTSTSLSWTDTSATETGFIIERCVGGPGCSDFTPYDEVGPGVTSYTDSQACSGQAYTYKVTAIDEGLSKDGNGCWTRRRKITFSNGFQPFTPTEVIVPFYAGDMQADFSDIRFYDLKANRELATYWIKSINPGVSATVWLMTGANDNIYLYYGNVDAIGASVGEEAFTELYDDFAGTVIDTDKWVEIEANATAIMQNDGLKLNYVTNSWTNALISTTMFERAPGNELVISLTTGTSPTVQDEYFALGWEKDQTTSANYIELMHGINFYGDNSYYFLYTIDNGNYYLPSPRRLFDDNTSYEIKIELKANGAKYYIKGGLYTDWLMFYERSNSYTGDDTLRLAIHQYNQNVTIHSVSVKHASSLPGASFVDPEEGDGATCLGFANTWTSTESGPVSTPADSIQVPTDLNAVVDDNGNVSLTWTSNTPDATNFVIERCDGSGCTYNEVTTIGAVTSYIDTSAPVSTLCSYQVRARKSAGACTWTSGPSVGDSVTTAPANVIGLTATALNSFQVELAWNGVSVTDEDGYEIEVEIFNGKFMPVATVVPDTTTYTDTIGIEPGKIYHYRVRPYRGSEKAAWSEASTDPVPAWQEGDSTCAP